MLPVGSYNRFSSDLLSRYGDIGETERVTFGILLADPRQTEAREHICNYLDVFNDESGNYFDFFIPGYFEEPWECDAEGGFCIGNHVYYFNHKDFNYFWRNLEIDFGIEYTFNPMLILMSMEIARRQTAEYIVIELDRIPPYGVSRSGMLFRRIFQTAKASPLLSDIQTTIRSTYVKGNWLDTIVDALGPDWLVEVKRCHNELKRFRIKTIM